MKLTHIFTNRISAGNLFQIPEQPLNVMLDVTNFCNNNCRFCYNPDSKFYKNDKPQPDVLEKIVTLLGATGTEEILYLGGEPFSGPTIKTLLSIGSKFGMFQRAVSNGSFFQNIDICSQLKKMGLDEIGISFHSSSPGIHDNIAGRQGAYKDALKGLENCIKAGLRTFIQYSPNSLNEKKDILFLAEFLHYRYQGQISFFDINRLLPIGHGRTDINIFLEDDEWFHLLTAATSFEEYGYEVHAELTPFCWLNQMAEKHSTPEKTLKKINKLNRGCFMWVAQLPLDYQGRIKFCPAGPPVGPSILDIKWPDFWQKWDQFNEYRSFMWNDKCIDFNSETSCQYFYRCLGGCKYSNGTHYEVDKYSIGIDVDMLKKDMKYGRKKEEQSNYPKRSAGCR